MALGTFEPARTDDGMAMAATPVTLVDAPGRMAIDPNRIEQAAAELDGGDAPAIVEWALERFGTRIAVGTSFTDTVLVHLVTSVAPDVEVVFADTGFHFAETLATMKRAQARYRLNLTVARPPAGVADVWSEGPEACCAARKVDPVDRAMAAGSHLAWFSGVRRVDGPARAGARAVEIKAGGRVKVNPLVGWSDDDVDRYITDHDLIVNPLLFQGYPSIGCWPCTSPVTEGDDVRAGRWAELGKTECGLNL